ncbi:nitronate monooxygenase [Domibacillus antri]|uniref:Probable nitronate monooxygenase n=1 Tax=Domibacillus antri TaxID=1714264 RepID=A0A1Q8Q5L9_9BACI|nr:nitronate monooxygenase family protein [Domibacillus antri]OLN22571.1 nitronate monooxygenase [Domibacillus antri]
MNFHNEVCTLLNIQYPIIQAGMAGDKLTTVDLITAVSEAGGLGTLGAAYMQPEDIRETIRNVKARTNKPFAVNLFCTDMTDDLTGIHDVQRFLDQMRESLGIEPGPREVQSKNLFEQQFQVLLEEEVPIISTAFGILPPYAMKLARERNMKVITMVTTVREALLAEEQGSDVIVAQGSEAGGHRGTFDMKQHPNGAAVGLFSLLPQIVDQVHIPVIAAGGVMDGRGLVSALALGAKGVQMGTAFLTTIESGAHESYKEALLNSTEERTVITKSFSGRPARGIRNQFIQSFEESGIPPLAFPTQNAVTGDIRRAAAKQNKPEFMSLWAGQGTRLLKKDQSASDVIHQVMKEAEQILGNLSTSKQV